MVLSCLEGPKAGSSACVHWETQEAAGLSHPHSHVMHPLSGKSASFMVSKPKAWHHSKTKRPEVPVHVQLSLQMSIAPISVTLLFSRACLALLTVIPSSQALLL